MHLTELAHHKSETYDLWLGRQQDGRLLMEGFLKRGGTLKHIVCSPPDKTIRTALDFLACHGREIDRPYLLGGRCDGSITTPVLALLLDFCARHGLDTQALYEAAYPGEGPLEADDIATFARWQGVRIPQTWTATCFSGLLESLTEINHHTLRSTLDEAARDIAFPRGVLEREGYVAFRGNTRCYGPSARFTWGHVITPTGEQVWSYDPWQSTNGVVRNHPWLFFIAVAARHDGNIPLARRLVEEAKRTARSPTNKRHDRGWLETLQAA